MLPHEHFPIVITLLVGGGWLEGVLDGEVGLVFKEDVKYL